MNKARKTRRKLAFTSYPKRSPPDIGEHMKIDTQGFPWHEHKISVASLRRF